MTTTMYMPCALCAAHTPQRKGDDTGALEAQVDADLRELGWIAIPPRLAPRRFEGALCPQCQKELLGLIQATVPKDKCGDCEWYSPTGCRQPIMWSTPSCNRLQRRATGIAP